MGKVEYAQKKSIPERQTATWFPGKTKMDCIILVLLYSSSLSLYYLFGTLSISSSSKQMENFQVTVSPLVQKAEDCLEYRYTPCGVKRG